QSVKTAQKKMVRNFVDFQQRAILQEHSSLAIGMAGEQATARNKLVEYRKNLLDKLEAIDVPGRILIRLNSNMDKFAKSNYDFPVEDGDTLLIPMKPSTVQVVGEVYGAGTLTYNSRKGADYYLHKAGGLTKYADLNRIFVIRANGETVSRFVRAMKIERGDAIIVPEAFKYKTLPGIFFKDVVQTLYQITLGAIVSITAINSL
ncbi:MAG: hypothetical protein ABH825_02865, partial [Candidatus Omnitrophota bacterium]